QIVRTDARRGIGEQLMEILRDPDLLESRLRSVICDVRSQQATDEFSMSGLHKIRAYNDGPAEGYRTQLENANNPGAMKCRVRLACWSEAFATSNTMYRSTQTLMFG